MKRTNDEQRETSHYGVQISNSSAGKTHIRLVNMVIRPLVRPSNDHDLEIPALDQVVVDRRFQEVAVLFEPFREVYRGGEGHFEHG